VHAVLRERCQRRRGCARVDVRGYTRRVPPLGAHSAGCEDAGERRGAPGARARGKLWRSHCRSPPRRRGATGARRPHQRPLAGAPRVPRTSRSSV